VAKFEVRAVSSSGKVINEIIEAENKDAVTQRIKARGFFITKIVEKKGALGGIKLGAAGPKIKPKDISIFARQFATMIGAGVPLVRCLAILSTQAENPSLGKLLEVIKQDVEGGLTFSDSLAKHPKYFNNLFVNLVKAGEAGGILDQILQRIAEYLEGAEQLKSKVKGAMTYPLVVASIAVLVVIFLLAFVLPTFKSIFDGMGGKLPLPTALLLSASDFVQKFFILIIAGLGGSIFGIKTFIATPFGKRQLDVWSLKLPAFGPMIKKVSVARFTRTLGTLISSGVPILQALEVTGDTAGNVVLKDAIDKTRNSIKEGESIAQPLKSSAVFPPMVVSMISVGEETGELDGMLIRIADFYEAEVDEAVKGLTSIIEPIIIVFMGVVIGGIVMAIFLPMLQLVNAK
jgi:type IV pilus assembly protein PilC